MEFDASKVGQSLKAKRTKHGLTQKELAEQMHVSVDTVRSWEQGKRTPILPDLVSLASVYDLDVSTLIGEIKENNMENKDMGIKAILDDLRLVDSDAKEADVSTGFHDVVKEWITYYCEYDEALNNDNIIDEKWCDNNDFLVLIDPDTGEVIGIRNYGRYSLKPEDILFRMKYIPMFTHQPENEGSLRSHVNRIIEMYKSEVSKKNRVSLKPLYLIRYCGTNNYIAWSLTENKPMCVYGYKKYRDYFFVSEYDTYDVRDVKENEEYTIILPSRDFIKETGLELYPNSWERKMRWDIWEPREDKILMDSIPDSIAEVYHSAVSVINKGRRCDYGMDKAFAHLEERVDMLEKLVKIGAPSPIIDREIELIEGSLNQIGME